MPLPSGNNADELNRRIDHARSLELASAQQGVVIGGAAHRPTGEVPLRIPANPPVEYGGARKD